MGERPTAQGALFSGFSLERHVPADHLLNRRPPVLDREQGGVDRARLAEPVRLQVLRYGVGRGQSHDTVACPLVRLELWPNLGDDGLREAAYRSG